MVPVRFSSVPRTPQHRPRRGTRERPRCLAGRRSPGGQARRVPPQPRPLARPLPAAAHLRPGLAVTSEPPPNGRPAAPSPAPQRRPVPGGAAALTGRARRARPGPAPRPDSAALGPRRAPGKRRGGWGRGAGGALPGHRVPRAGRPRPARSYLRGAGGGAGSRRRPRPLTRHGAGSAARPGGGSGGGLGGASSSR